MQIEGALIKEQGVSFAIAVVKPNVLGSNSQCDQMRRALTPVFNGVPIILMAQDHRGVPTYQGRQDIVRFLANTDLTSIPWRKFTIN